jgi:hypothetical protein
LARQAAMAMAMAMAMIANDMNCLRLINSVI